MIENLKRHLARGYRALFPEGQSATVVAVSVFVGVFIAVMPTFGVALPLTVLATALCRVPKGPGLIASFIATPPTLLLFFYPLSYFLGETLTAKATAQVKALGETPEVAPLSVQDIFTLWHEARSHVVAFLLGTLIVSLITAALVSAVCYWIISRRRHSKLRASSSLVSALGPPQGATLNSNNIPGNASSVQMTKKSS